MKLGFFGLYDAFTLCNLIRLWQWQNSFIASDFDLLFHVIMLMMKVRPSGKSSERARNHKLLIYHHPPQKKGNFFTRVEDDFSIYFLIVTLFYGHSAVIVAQLAEWSLPRPEVLRSSPVIGKILQWIYLLLTVEKTNRRNRGREWPLWK